jgi:hypothetical protein
MALVGRLPRPRASAQRSTQRLHPRHAIAGAVLLLAASIAGVTSCQAILGIEEGKPRPPGACVEPADASVLHWAITMQGDATDMANAVAIGPEGAIAVVGQFKSSQITVGSNGPTLTHDADEFNDGFVVELNPDGSVRWARSIRSGSEVQPTAVAYSGPDVVVAGTFFDDLTVTDPQADKTVAYPDAAAGSSAAFLIRFDGEGNVATSVTAHATGPLLPGVQLSKLAADEQGDVWAAGSWVGALQLGGQTTVADGGVVNGFVAQLSAENWSLLHMAAFRSSGYSSVATVTPEPGTSSFLAGGQYRANLIWGTGGGLSSGSPDEDGWLGRFTWSDGIVEAVGQPQEYFESPGGGGSAASPGQEVGASAVMPESGAVVAIRFSGGIVIGGSEQGPLASIKESIVARLRADLSWEQLGPRPQGSAIERFIVTSVVVAPTGEVAFGGSLLATGLSLNDGGTVFPDAVGSGEGFVAFLARDMSYRYGIAILDDGLSSVNAMAIDPCGRVVAVGATGGGREGGSAAVVSPERSGSLAALPHHTAEDAFVMMLGP